MIHTDSNAGGRVVALNVNEARCSFLSVTLRTGFHWFYQPQQARKDRIDEIYFGYMQAVVEVVSVRELIETETERFHRVEDLAKLVMALRSARQGFHRFCSEVSCQLMTTFKSER